MRNAIGLAVMLVLGASSLYAEDVTPLTAANAPTIQISDSEAVDIMQTIKGYAEGAKGVQYIKSFDRKKGQEVNLRLDRIVTDDPNRVVFTEEGQVAICTECTQVDLTNIDEKTKLPKEGDKYEVWFLIKRGNVVTCRVLDVIIKSVNGNPMYKWTKDEAGKWSATLVPDPAQ